MMGTAVSCFPSHHSSSLLPCYWAWDEEVRWRRKSLQLPDPALLAVHKVKNSPVLGDKQCGELNLRRAFFMWGGVKKTQTISLLFLLFSFLQQVSQSALAGWQSQTSEGRVVRCSGAERECSRVSARSGVHDRHEELPRCDCQPHIWILPLCSSHSISTTAFVHPFASALLFVLWIPCGCVFIFTP